MARKATGGLGLGGIIIICGVLYYTGVGGQLLDHMQSFNQRCYSLSTTIGRSVAEPLCKGIDYGVNGITKVAETVGGWLHWTENLFGGKSTGKMDLASVDAFGRSVQKKISGYASSSDQLTQMMRAGPDQWFAGGDASQRFQKAMDNFSISQHYLAQGGTSQALPWLTKGAQQPDGFGVLSQISLGDVYRKGGGGIQADPARARAYYNQAATSLSQLNQSNSPQAKQLLKALPASPQETQRQLLQAVDQLK
jgi:hypothetical protein